MGYSHAFLLIYIAKEMVWDLVVLLVIRNHCTGFLLFF